MFRVLKPKKNLKSPRMTVLNSVPIVVARFRNKNIGNDSQYRFCKYICY